MNVYCIVGLTVNIKGVHKHFCMLAGMLYVAYSFHAYM